MERKVVEVYSAKSSVQAEMILDTFDDNQIPAYKKDVGFSGIMNVYGANSLGEEEIYVAEEDAEQALEVLRGMGLWSWNRLAAARWEFLHPNPI